MRFAASGPLAYIATGFMGPERHLIVFHPVLNHPQTPVEVVRFIAKHELIHLVYPPAWIDFSLEMHSPAFWAMEAAVGPERFAVWSWIHQNLRSCAHNTRWGFGVNRRWHAISGTPRTPYTPELPFNGERWDRVCPGTGAQMRLPPDWPARPLPMEACGGTVPARS